MLVDRFSLARNNIDNYIRVLYGYIMSKIEKRRYSDRPGYLSHFVSERRRKLKRMAVELKGGCCQICGYNKYVGALDFHHVDEGMKSFDLSSRGLTRSWDRIKEEINKCVLVCANCHREVHAGLIDLQKLTQMV
ncbi:MAG: hypothetical protein UX64_C0046G0002 [Microgenomates group bacterium GW2011_GWC2_46_7]|nr:MAG: hypothetical protein UX64_C0046G0002 [Microgenomates group bacterium GW2011_GWC2_46_7]